MTGFRHGRRVSLLALVLVGALFVTACGKPAYTYVSNKDANTYFKVPSDWPASEETEGLDYLFAQVIFQAQDRDSAAFDTFKKVRWAAEYDAPYDLKASVGGPLVYGLVTPVPPTFQGDISLDWLRDMLAPVSETTRNKILAGGGSLPPAFEILDDEVLTPEAGFRGVRVVYNRLIQSSATGQAFLATYDLTAMTNNDSSVVYALLAVCSAECYRMNAVKINDVVTSFTVRKSP